MTSLPRTVITLAALYAVGAAWAAADGLASLGDAIVNGTYINAPLVIVAAQVLGAAAAVRFAGRRGGTAGAALVLLACTVSLAAVAFDGDLGHAGVSGAQVAFQVVIAVVTAAAWALAAVRCVPGAGRRAPQAARTAPAEGSAARSA